MFRETSRTMMSEDENCDFFRFAQNLASGFKAVHFWHIDVHYDRVRSEFASFLYGFGAVSCLSADLPVWPAFEEVTKRLAYKLPVIDYQDAHDIPLNEC